ncbi:MAG: helix-turn-helix domain-containing protein, partial [Fusobacteriaceae bacterium]
MNRSRDIYNKINEVLDINKVSKKALAEKLGITIQGLSYQLNSLKRGGGVSTKTLEAVEELTGYN